MIIEQIRYYIDEDYREQILLARREVNQVRDRLGLPTGLILIADASPEEGPALIWQCGYEDENEMVRVTEALMGNADYEAARDRLGALTERAEMELYVTDEDVPVPPADAQSG